MVNVSANEIIMREKHWFSSPEPEENVTQYTHVRDDRTLEKSITYQKYHVILVPTVKYL